MIKDALLMTRPISRRAAEQLELEAERNLEGRSEFVKDLVRELSRRISPAGSAQEQVKPVDAVYGRYSYTNAPVLTPTYGKTVEKELAFNANNDGDFYGRTSNYRAGLTSHADDIGAFSFYLNPEYRSSNDTENIVFNKGYGVLGFSWIDIVAGRDSQWRGPGHNGALLLSNNAAPLDMVKLTAPEPQYLPWIIKYLGPFQYTLFVARLDESRQDFSPPYLDGFHVDFKPAPGSSSAWKESRSLAGAAGR